MKCLVVISHPQSDSLCHHFAGHIVTRLEEQQHQVLIEDLYQQQFDPLLSPQERSTYYSDDYDTSRIDQQVQRLLQAEALVLVFPTWWFNFPAILKGWFDRVWGPGIAYDHANDLGPIQPRLTHLRKVLVVTSLGSPWWVDRLLMWQPVKRIMKYALLGTCAKNSKLNFLSLYGSEKISDSKRERFVRKIDKVLIGWDNEIC